MFPLTLALLVARVATDDADDALALDDLALGTNRFDGCSNFHGLLVGKVIKKGIRDCLALNSVLLVPKDRLR